MEYLRAIASDGRDANPFFTLMGIDIISFGDGEAALSMEIRPDMMSGAGWLQGGIYTSLSDEAMALAICTRLREGERIATISETTSFLRGVQAGPVSAHGRVIRMGRRVAFAEGEVRAGDQVLAATRASFAVMRHQEK